MNIKMILDKIDLLVCCCCCFLKKILFFFLRHGIQIFVINIKMKKKKSEIDLYVLISDPNQQHGSRADIMFVKAACFSVAALVISEFGIEEKEKKMWSGRLVSLLHLHEKQEGISIPLSLSSIYSSCQYYLINDPHALFKKQFGRLHFGKEKKKCV